MTAGPGTAAAGIPAFLAGQALRGLTRVGAALRPAAKPLHPRGLVTSGVLHRAPTRPGSGVDWLDDDRALTVLVRRSRALGLPPPLPDVFGLALRVSLPEGGYGDVLFASTGLGRLGRFVLTAGRRPGSRPMTTLLPYRTAAGPVLLCAVLHDEQTVGLGWAVGTGRWRGVGEIRLAPQDAGADALVSFDPVLHPLPGLDTYRWVRLLREPAYRSARRARTR